MHMYMHQFPMDEMLFMSYGIKIVCLVFFIHSKSLAKAK